MSKEKKSVCRTLFNVAKESLDFKLLVQNKKFMLMTLSNFFIYLGYFIPFIYIPIRAKELEIIHYPWLLSIIGIVNIPGRIFFGLMADQKKLISAVDLNTACNLFACVTLFAFFWMTIFLSQACFAVTFAIAVSGMSSLSTPYIVEMVGSERFSNANGIINLVRGVGCIVGPFIAGYLSEATGSVFYSFKFAGSCYLVAFALSLTISIMNLCDRRRKTVKFFIIT
jgi:MFS family permease